MPNPSWVSAVALTAGAALALSGCGGSEPASDARLTVYVSAPRRGPEAVDGADIAGGAQKALAAANGEAGGVAVGIVHLTSSDDPARVSHNARRAVEDSTSIAYIGELDSTATLSSLPITNDARMLQVSPTAGASDLVAPFPGSDAVPPETQPSGERTFGTLAELGGRPRQLGAEAMAVVLDSINRAGDPLDRASVVDAFFATSDRESPVGTYSIDELGRAGPE